VGGALDHITLGVDRAKKKRVVDIRSLASFGVVPNLSSKYVTTQRHNRSLD